MVAGDQQSFHAPIVPPGYWSPCSLLVWNQGFLTPLGGLTVSTGTVKATDIRFPSSQFPHVSALPCYQFVPPDCYWSQEEGWSTFSLKSQYDRFGLPNYFWSLTNVNENFEICDTYPRVLYVPSMVSKNILYGSSRFRSRGRFPVLTYLHPNGKSALCRSSQPLAGFSSKSTEDQVLLEAIRNSNPDSNILYVVDTRPAINAFTNRAQGKGYEDTNVYRNAVIQFFDIENIHVVRSSLEKLLKGMCTVKHLSCMLCFCMI
ncbi:unnamed protein product [Schistosoma curassoni]|uniref:Myotubularin phosphatase domain-containing protein n=1 Tax=Schistosoma curassoni TaxID=6186 RepID=A0A183JH63_9TREM|nr:unnamed protein product [Schistosoma curassoni]